MKNILCTLALCSLTFVVKADIIKKIDTIQANEKMNIALFFPADIRQASTGARHIVFNYNRETRQNLGLLKAMPGEDSNLLVITDDGAVYSYIISYAKELEKLNFFISPEERIGREDEKKPKPTITNKFPKANRNARANNSIKVPDSSNYVKFQSVCSALLKLPERKSKTKTKKGISLGIRNIVYYKEHVYLQMEIANKSGIDFDINDLLISKTQGNKNRKSSYQKLSMKPIYMHQVPDVVRHGDTIRFVIVLTKFTLHNKEQLQLNLLEEKGSRTLSLNFK